MVDGGSGANTGTRMWRHPTNTYVSREQRAYLEARAALETERKQATETVGRRKVTMSDIVRYAIDRLIEDEPLESEAA